MEWKPLWEVTIWDKRFIGVDKSKQPKVHSFKHVSAAELKKLSLDNGNVKLLATGKFEGTTTKELAGKNLNNLLQLKPYKKEARMSFFFNFHEKPIFITNVRLTTECCTGH